MVTLLAWWCKSVGDGLGVARLLDESGLTLLAANRVVLQQLLAHTIGIDLQMLDERVVQ